MTSLNIFNINSHNDFHVRVCKCIWKIPSGISWHLLFLYRKNMSTLFRYRIYKYICTTPPFLVARPPLLLLASFANSHTHIYIIVYIDIFYIFIYKRSHRTPAILIKISKPHICLWILIYFTFFLLFSPSFPPISTLFINVIYIVKRTQMLYINKNIY